MGFDFGPPRARRSSTGGTAEAGAAFIEPHAPTIRHMTLEIVEQSPATGEQVHEILRERGVRCVLYSVKPRLSELKNAGLVTDSGERGISDSGKLRSVVWRATTAQERSQFLARKAAEAEHEEQADG